MKRLPKAGLEILHLGMEACLFSFVARYLCECQLHRNVSLLSLPYKEDCNQILYAKKKKKVTRDSPRASSLLTILPFEIHKACPGVVSLTGASNCVYQLLVDFGTQRSSPFSLTLGISLVVVFW